MNRNLLLLVALAFIEGSAEAGRIQLHQFAKPPVRCGDSGAVYGTGARRSEANENAWDTLNEATIQCEDDGCGLSWNRQTIQTYPIAGGFETRIAIRCLVADRELLSMPAPVPPPAPPNR